MNDGIMLSPLSVANNSMVYGIFIVSYLLLLQHKRVLYCPYINLSKLVYQRLIITYFCRAKLDWCMPPLPQSKRAVSEIAELFLDGDRSSHLVKHLSPALGAKAQYFKRGKVLQRQGTQTVHLSYLL